MLFDLGAAAAAAAAAGGCEVTPLSSTRFGPESVYFSRSQLFLESSEENEALNRLNRAALLHQSGLFLPSSDEDVFDPIVGVSPPRRRGGGGVEAAAVRYADGVFNCNFPAECDGARWPR
ncbi:uncharacterized protein V6R79_001418 [Siganus canaliculatus]